MPNGGDKRFRPPNPAPRPGLSFGSASNGAKNGADQQVPKEPNGPPLAVVQTKGDGYFPENR
jgi:hypothetical protein